VVELSAALVTGLAGLTAAIDDPEVDIAESVQRLAAAVGSAVPSYLGLSLNVEAHGREIIIAAMNAGTDSADISTSLSMPLARMPPAAEITLILYGATRGAFVDLAADLGWLLGSDDPGFVFDRHLSAPVESISGLADLSQVNQAIGVLVAGGYTVEQALKVLDALAAEEHCERHVAAARLLADLHSERQTP
jgi:hypothetical protein